MQPKHNFLKLGLIFLFLGGLIVLFVYFNITRPRLLILHSYDTTYSWTRDVNVGLRRILDHYTNYAVRWHYMDTKRHPDPSFKRVAGIGAQRAIELWRPHVLIAIDDDAQEFAAKHFVNHSDINLVFAGVNGEIEPYGYTGASNVTGILERKQLQAVKEIAQVVGTSLGLPNPLRILHIGDTSGSVAEDAKFMDQFDWAPVRFLGSKLVGTFDGWQQSIAKAPETADIILITNYRRLARSSTDKSLVPNREVMGWTINHSHLAVIGTNVFNVEDGANLAVGVSPYEQGEVAAKMAISLIEGHQEASGIAVRSTQQYIVSMRKQGLQQSGIVLPSVYEAFARATNNFFDAPAEGPVIHLAATRAATPLSSPPAVAAPQLPGPIPAEVETEAVPAKVSPPRRSRLTIEARQASWAEVLEAGGRSRLRRTLEAGSRLSLDVVPPLRVKLGKPEAVQLNLDGQALDIRPKAGRYFTLE